MFQILLLMLTFPWPGPLAMCPLPRMPFWGCRASSGHYNWFSIFFFFFFFFLVLRMPPLFLLGIGKTRTATLIRTYFFVIYRPNCTKVCNFTREIINSRRENNLVHYMFLGGQWVFWGASGFSDSLPQYNGCHSTMSRPEYWLKIEEFYSFFYALKLY